MLVNIVHVIILLLEFILILVPYFCDLLLLVQMDALDVELEFVCLTLQGIYLLLQAFLLIVMPPLEGLELILMPLGERIDLFLRVLFYKRLILFVAHHDGLIDLPILRLLLLILPYLRLQQLNLLHQDTPIPAMLFLPRLQLFLQPGNFDIHNGQQQTIQLKDGNSLHPIQIINIILTPQSIKMEVFSAKHPNKQNRSQSPTKELLKMRIELSDKIFQINKLEEDFAQEKAKHFIDFQKERQGLNRVIKELKERSLVENEEWGKKIQEFREKAEEDVRIVKRECQERIALVQVAIKKDVQVSFEEQIKCLNRKIKENQCSYTQALSKLQIDHDTFINSLNQTHKHQLEDKQKQHKSAIQTIKKQHQSKIQTLQKLYICEERAKTAIEREYQDYIQQKVREKLQFENQIESLRQKVKTLEQEVRTHQREAQSLKERQVITKSMYQQKLKDSNVQKMKEIQKVVDEFNQKCIAQRQQYESQLRRASQQVKQMSGIYKQKQNKWRERGQLLLKTVQNSSKPNDGDSTIKKLELQLMKKQALLQKQKQTLKNCRLQLQNMQQIYDKMFVSNNYLYKFRSKTFKVKKVRVLGNQLNQSNNSISMVERFHTEA